MRRLKRNQQAFEYYTYQGRTDEVVDGLKTGHQVKTYANGVTAMGCISFEGSSAYKPYGVDKDYSVCIIPDNPIAGISEETKVIIGAETYFVAAVITSINEQRIYLK